MATISAYYGSGVYGTSLYGTVITDITTDTTIAVRAGYDVPVNKPVYDAPLLNPTVDPFSNAPIPRFEIPENKQTYDEPAPRIRFNK